jgi:hypothetical protein
MQRTLVLFAFLAVSAFAQHWDIEQVDSAGWGAGVQMRWHPDGRLFLCYSDTNGTIRLSSFDTAWHCESVPTVGQPVSGTQAFDIDRRGSIGVLSYVGTDGHYWYASKTGAGWTDIQTPFRSGVSVPITLDTAGIPAITIQLGDAFLLARMRDTLWVTDTLATGDPQWNPFFGACALGSGADGVFWGVFYYSFSYPGQDIFGTDLYSFYAGDSGITYNEIAGGYMYSVDGASGCVDQQGSVHSCYGYWWQTGSGLYLDQTQIDPDWAERTAVEFDSLGRSQLAYVPSNGGLMYRYLDSGVWHVFDLQTQGLTALDLILDENSQPLIAYTTSGGVFLAHGVDIAGQSEERQEPTAYSLRLTATVVRGVLWLQGDRTQNTGHGAELLDAAGRKVLALKAGANDVRGLAPGVYFIREPSAAGGERLAVQKVVIAR